MGEASGSRHHLAVREDVETHATSGNGTDVPQASNPWTVQLRKLCLRDLPTRSWDACAVDTCSQIANSVGIARQAECWILSFGRAASCFSRFRAQGCGSGFHILMQPWGSSLTCSLFVTYNFRLRPKLLSTTADSGEKRACASSATPAEELLGSCNRVLYGLQ